MTLEAKLAEWLKQPGTFITGAEGQFIVEMRAAAIRGVGYGWMQQVIEWEWQSKDQGSWGPEYFQKKIDELKAASQ